MEEAKLMELKTLKINDIKIPEVRVTARFTEEAWEQFRSSYKQTGQIDPILVYEVDGVLWLCDGLHRLIEAKNQGETDILSVVVPGDLSDVFTKNILVDHLRGRTPVSEMVQVIKFLWKELNIDSDGIVEKTGLSRDYVERLMKVSELTPQCLQALDEERIGVGHASALARISDPDRQENVLQQLLLYRWTIRELEEFIRQVEEVAQPPEQPLQEEAPRPEPVITCFYCRQGYKLGECANPNICVSCSGILLATIQQAEREFKAEQEQRAE